ncbi:MAG: SO_0444 family Cu/Zn efflux transporter [Planctomycetota bacterium]
MTTLLNILIAFWATLAEMAPWLIFGFVAAGVLSVFFSVAFIERHLGGGGFGPVVKASVLGVPLPLCSCGVIPVGASLHRHGASKGATSSFLLSTPQTGVDSILATYALMGPVFAVVRPAVALINGVFGGLLIDAADRPGDKPVSLPSSDAETATKTGGSCCSSQRDSAGASSCCGSDNHESKPSPKWRRALRYGLLTLPADIAVALLVGLVVAALITALVPADALAPYLGGGLLAMGAAVLVGAPLYVCATASIPIAMGLMAAGAPPGAALAFLIAGPATNAATISVTWNVLGRRTGLLYLLSVVVTAAGAGLLLDAAFSAEALRLPEVVGHAHEHGISPIDHLWAALMLTLLVPAIWNRLRPRRVIPAATSDAADASANAVDSPIQFTITGMSCSRCVEAIERGLREISGVRQASVDLQSGQASVLGDALDPQQLTDAVTGLGFGVERS